ARKRLTTLLIAKEFGGQSVVSPEIFNWIGTKSISGADLARSFKEHVKEYASDTFTIAEGEWITAITKNDSLFTVTTNKGSYTSKSVLVATGSGRKKLEVPGAAEFENKGVVYCASCDGPLFADQDVVVIGGGNAAFESAAQLLAYCKSVTLLHRSERFRADEITVENVLAHKNMKAITEATITRVMGDKFVTGIAYTDKEGVLHELPATGIFVEIGLVPSTEFLGDLVSKDEFGRIIIDPWTQRASIDGLWAAGDCTTVKYHQNNIAAGDGVRALEDLYLYLKTGK
nr:FAD-dependent oxidoreductase [Candidatus Paceibacterota bacterium]